LFDYDLPPQRIAQEPARPRDTSRLMVLDRSSDAVAHHAFRELPSLLDAGDLLVVNQTMVVPARLSAKKISGGRVELLACRPADGSVEEAKAWWVMGRPGRALRPGCELLVAGERLIVGERVGEMAVVRGERPLLDVMRERGEVPLPPYIERPHGPRAEDPSDYQTLFSRQPGAVAAPTASLHFTDQVLAELAAHGVQRAALTLHVGPGTFVPVRDEHADDVREHSMHAEWYEVPAATCEAVAATREAGHRVVAVGTTTVRALESWHQSGSAVGEADLFIYPGYEFASVDALLTNFHLPRSTLLMLVSAFAGRERVLSAYLEAVRCEYRFFSYGDAMLIR
jgi:S-adenosylmethionine:tRNA ribosyltransferase-isomerase